MQKKQNRNQKEIHGNGDLVGQSDLSDFKERHRQVHVCL